SGCVSPGLTFCCCYLWSGPQRDLHSFPTRRSSDLAARRIGSGWGFRNQTSWRVTMASKCPSIPARRTMAWASRRARVVTTASRRSEEHTSELQSRENLVCRLLLEKKKKQRHPRQLK